MELRVDRCASKKDFVKRFNCPAIRIGNSPAANIYFIDMDFSEHAAHMIEELMFNETKSWSYEDGYSAGDYANGIFNHVNKRLSRSLSVYLVFSPTSFSENIKNQLKNYLDVRKIPCEVI